MAQPWIVDANPLLSALLGGKAEQIVLSGVFELYSTQYTLFEVEKYLPQLALKIGKSDLDFFRAFQLLPVVACQPAVYDARTAEADELIGERDAKDVPLLALVLTLRFPLWTNDRDFEGIPGIEVVTTAELILQT